MKKSIVLLSGGLDSSTVLAIAINQGFEVIALSFIYGQRHNYEIECAKEIANYILPKRKSIESNITGDMRLVAVELTGLNGDETDSGD